MDLVSRAASLFGKQVIIQSGIYGGRCGRVTNIDVDGHVHVDLGAGKAAVVSLCSITEQIVPVPSAEELLLLIGHLVEIRANDNLKLKYFDKSFGTVIAFGVTNGEYFAWVKVDNLPQAICIPIRNLHDAGVS